MSVLRVRGADKYIALNAQFIPEGAPLGRHLGYKFGFRHTGFARGALDVDAMLVRAGGHHHVVAEHALVAADGVAHDRRVGVADVWQAVRVVDRRREVEFAFLSHFRVMCFAFLGLQFSIAFSLLTACKYVTLRSFKHPHRMLSG